MAQGLRLCQAIRPQASGLRQSEAGGRLSAAGSLPGLRYETRRAQSDCRAVLVCQDGIARGLKQRAAPPRAVVKPDILEQAELLSDVQLGLDELLGGCPLPRFEIGLQARLGLFDRFAEAPLPLELAFGGVFLTARRARPSRCY